VTKFSDPYNQNFNQIPLPIFRQRKTGSLERTNSVFSYKTNVNNEARKNNKNPSRLDAKNSKQIRKKTNQIGPSQLDVQTSAAGPAFVL